MATTALKIDRKKSGNPFLDDVHEGLSAAAKYIPPKYFYDAEGDRLFSKIMGLPEYYLTRTEQGILTNYRSEILRNFNDGGSFDLVELGAGDGFKTKILLRHFTERDAHFRYVPIDISNHALSGLTRSIAAEFPDLEVAPVPGEYFRALHSLQGSTARKAVLFLGASIGNFTFDQALHFLRDLRETLNQGDQVLIGFDLKKNPREILAAYNDSQGVTRDFNLNLLKRINRELGADFTLSQFEHYPLYDPQTGEAKSFLVSKCAQEVAVPQLGKTFHFEDGETIHTEISRKYSLSEIALLAELAGFSPVQNFTDPKNRFVDALWKC